MPAKGLSITVVIEMVPFEPDGSTCDVCGDTIFLEGKKAVFTVEGGDVFGKRTGELDGRFCQSCGDALEKEMEGGEACGRGY